MPGRSTPMIRSPSFSAMARASSGICRRAPGVPCIQTIAGPCTEPYSAKLSRRSPRTATVPSSAGRLMLLMGGSVSVRRDGSSRRSTMLARSMTAPSSRPSPTTTGPSTTSTTTQVMLSWPPASARPA